MLFVRFLSLVFVYLYPDFVHVLYKGRIVKSGGKELAKELEVHGYDWIKQEVEHEDD